MNKIRPVSDLRNHFADISRMVHETEQPVFLTKNGYGDMVVMSMETYEATIRRDQIYKELEISERQVAEGKTRPAKEALADLRVKYEL